MTKPRPEKDVRGRKRTRLAERGGSESEDECKSTTKMVDNNNPPDLSHSHDDTACSNTVVGYDRETVVPDSTAVSEYDADNSDARTDDVFSQTTRRIYSETEEAQERDDKLCEYVKGTTASIISTLAMTNDCIKAMQTYIDERLKAMHTDINERLKAMDTDINERFDALRDEIDDLFDVRQEQDDN